MLVQTASSHSALDLAQRPVCDAGRAHEGWFCSQVLSNGSERLPRRLPANRLAATPATAIIGRHSHRPRWPGRMVEEGRRVCSHVS
jgi:hypothetical protein